APLSALSGAIGMASLAPKESPGTLILARAARHRPGPSAGSTSVPYRVRRPAYAALCNRFAFAPLALTAAPPRGRTILARPARSALGTRRSALGTPPLV